MLLSLIVTIQTKGQTLTAPQVPFLQRTSASTPTQKVYNVKGDFTLIGNTNLTLDNYSTSTDNEGNSMKFVDIDGDPTTFNSSMATLELSNLGENSANQSCSNILFAGLYWTGKSDDANEIFTSSKLVQSGTQAVNTNWTIINNQPIANTNYILNITRNNPSSTNRSPIYSFSGNGNSYVFNYTNNSGSNRVTLSINGLAAINIPVTVIVSGSTATATLTTPYLIADGNVNLTINELIRSTSTSLNLVNIQNTSSASVNVSGTIPAYTTLTKNYDKKVISLKGPGTSTYSTITTTSDIRFPGVGNSGIFIGYQEITDYVKTHGPGAYTVADIALVEGNNGAADAQHPGFSGGWNIIVIYNNPLMKSRAITLFDGYAYVNGQLSGGGEYGTIPISGFTTVGAGQVNMKLGVMAAEGDVGLNGDYLAVQKLNADPLVYTTTNYLTLNHAGNTTNNFFDSSIFPFPTAGNSNPNLVNNTGVDFSMFTIPNAGNLVIGNNQTATTFRFGSTSEVYTIFGFAMSVDAYIPEPNGLISVNSINNVTNPPILNALPGQTINYSLNITNEGTEATNNTIISIPIPSTVIFHSGTIVFHTYHGFTSSSTPIYNSATNTITWNLGTLPITAGHPEYIYADISFSLDITTNCSILLNAGCSPIVSLETGNISGTGATSGSSFTKYFFQGYDTTTCHLPIDGAIKVAINTASCLASMAGPDQISACGGDTVTLAATAGTNGSWTIVSGPTGGGEVFSNSTSPTSGFYSPNLGVYTLKWTTSCATTDNVIITLTICNVVDFDGIDDHINFKNNFNLNSGNFSIEAWVKSNAANSNTQSIFSKRISPTSSNGYDLRLVNNRISFNWNNSSIIATHAIDTNRWYHIAVTFDGTNYNLYLDGIIEKTALGVNPTINNVDCILGAMNQNTNLPFNYYNGYADELRIWNTSLTVEQIRQTMNQEIINDGSSNVKGVIIPKNISGLSWSNLVGYYQMNQASDINNGYLIDKSGNSKNGKLKGIYNQEPDTAPIPYTSAMDGSWENDTTWTNYPVWDTPNSFGLDGTTKIDWNIVKTFHNISSNGNKNVLGLLVNSNLLRADNDSKIEISSYLKLDGKIDLVGKSQLVQTLESDLDITSAGSIERDQQGQSSIYNYNYWSSPVSPVNTISNNTNYSVDGIMKDGTNPSIPMAINWVGGYDGAPTNPISLSKYWLFKFDNYGNNYFNWAQITENNPLRVGQGFTLKGSGATGLQNYIFTGKPNNGLITTNTVGSDQLLLTGNPYPSALDATAFINDNSSSIDGTLYFWEHYSTNITHDLRDYQGGYAERNLVGGIPPVSPALISGLGSSTRIPGQFIPVGQGFFVNGLIGFGGTVTYNNNQRGFHKEDDAGVSNIMFKTTTNSKKPKPLNNSNDPIQKDNFMRIRLGFNSYNKYHRQLLLGFMNENATSGIDYGYDGLSLDDFPNDMYFLNGENQLAIQGEGFFKENISFPLGVKTDTEGKVSFLIDGLENFDKKQKVFIYDKQSKIYHNIKNQPFEILLPIGIYDNRFYLCFKEIKKKKNKEDEDEDKEEDSSKNTIQSRFYQSSRVLNIANLTTDDSISFVSLYTINGQFITKWDVTGLDQINIQIPILNISSGIYITKITSSSGEISKKIIIP